MTLLCTIVPPLHVHIFGQEKQPKLLSRSYYIDKNELEMLRPLGGGTFGDVLKARYKQTNVAVKRIRGNMTESRMRTFGKEVEVLAALHHPNVVMMMGLCVKPPLLVMEYLGRGSLFRVFLCSVLSYRG